MLEFLSSGCYSKGMMSPVSITNEPLKAFFYGFLSVITLGIIPSYLARAELPKVSSYAGSSIATGGVGLLQDFHNIACDIARAGNKISKCKA